MSPASGGSKLPIKFITPSPGAYFASGQPFELRWNTQESAAFTVDNAVFRVCMKSNLHASKEKRGKGRGYDNDESSYGDDNDWNDDEAGYGGASSSFKDDYDVTSTDGQHESGKWQDSKAGFYDSGKWQDTKQVASDMEQTSWDDQDEDDSTLSKGQASGGSEEESSSSLDDTSDDSQAPLRGDSYPSSQDTDSDPNSLCGSAMYPSVQRDGKDYIVSLVVPEIVPSSVTKFYIQLTDGSGTARSPTFSLGTKELSPIVQGTGQQYPLGTHLSGTTTNGTGADNSTTSITPDLSMLVASRAPPAPTAAMAIPLAIVGGVLIVAVVLAWRAQKKARLEKEASIIPVQSHGSLSSMYGTKADLLPPPDGEHRMRQREVPVPLFMPNSVGDDYRVPPGLGGSRRPRMATRDVPVPVPVHGMGQARSRESFASVYSELSAKGVDAPRDLAPARVRGKAGGDKRLPSPPLLEEEEDEFEDVDVDDPRESMESDEEGIKPRPGRGRSLYNRVQNALGTTG